jgi:hypothetical protein
MIEKLVITVHRRSLFQDLTAPERQPSAHALRRTDEDGALQHRPVTANPTSVLVRGGYDSWQCYRLRRCHAQS